MSDDEKRAGKQAVDLGRDGANETDLGGLAADARWQVPTRPSAAVWTDDYSDLAAYLLFQSEASRVPH